MRKQLLLKMLLMTVGLFVGTSAWAAVGDKTTNLDIDFSNAISESKVSGTVGSITIGGSNTAIENGILRVGNGTSTASLTGSAVGSGDQVVVTFDLAFGKLIGKSVWFRLKDSSSNVIGEFNFTPYAGTINTNSFGISTDDIYYSSNTVIWDRKVSFTITLDYKTRKITTATTCYKSGLNKAATNAEHTVDMTNSNPMATFEIGSSYNNDDRRCSFDNLKVETIEGEATTATSYTIYYKKGEDVVKTVSSSDGVVGQVVTASTAIDGDDSKHYLTTAAEAPSMTLVANAASNVLNVSVRSPYTATVRLTKNINGSSSYVDYPFTETDTKDCTYAVPWSMYEKDGDDYYALTEESDYAAIGTFTDGQTIEKTVNYTTAAPDIMSFKEIDGGSIVGTSYSGGSYTNVNEQLANITVDAGVYDVIFNVIAKAGQGSNHRNEGVSVNDVNVANLEGNENGIRTLRIIVENDNSTITAYGNGSQNYTDNLDYVIVRKIIDGTTVSKNITTAGWATYCSPCALDLEHATGLTNAYIITGGENKIISKVSVKNGTVPANTGLLLEGVEGTVTTVTIPVVANSLTDVSANKLVGKTAKYGLPAEAGYVLMNEEDGLGFYMNRNDFYVGANTAYLPSDFDGAAAPAFYSLFDSNVTGISATLVNSEKVNSEIYNLAGQRVAAPTKGLYIVNGKKMVLK